MRVSYNWLKQYVNLEGISPEELAEKLTRSGVEVDAVEYRNQGVEQTVVGYVTDKTPHPDADKLNVCQVDAGTGEMLQIVCGAKNVAQGQKVPVALVGAKLPGDLKIKRAKLRGVESQGMICSAKELGLPEKLLPKHQTEGILVLPEDAEIGTDIVSLLGLDDAILELGLTPNRSDCLSMIGVAYEVGAILNREVKLPEPGTTKTGEAEHIEIEINAVDECTRYAAKVVRNVTVSASPLWMQERLIAVGIRPINNIVDITNYVMMLYGQPLHAFDYDKLSGNRIVVRTANEGEPFVTLDDVERKLAEGMLLITDGEKPIALAGVMGGANSEVSGNTQAILLESAVFRGGSVRKTARQLGMRSEASARFEKGVNPEAAIPALDYAVYLMAEYAGGTVSDHTSDLNLLPDTKNEVKLRVSRLNHVIGTTISGSEAAGYLERLNFDVAVEGDQLNVIVPARRRDISREEDLIEEVIRLYGYDNIPTTLPTGKITPGFLTRKQSIRRVINRTLTALGWYEAVTYGMTNPKNETVISGLHAKANAIPLALPMSEERSMLRTSLIPHLLEVTEYNKNRGLADISIFEIANTFITEEEKITKQPQEELVWAGVISGSRQQQTWHGGRTSVDFYDVKGTVDYVLSQIGATDIHYSAQEKKGFHPGRTAAIVVGGKEVGFIGQLHPDAQQHFDLNETYAYQISIPALLEAIPQTEIAFSQLPKYPAITRDMAVVVDRHVEVGQTFAIIQETGGQLLQDVSLFDVYEGDRIDSSKKSLAFSLTYRSNERTLTDEEVNSLHQSIVDALTTQLGAQLRA